MAAVTQQNSTLVRMFSLGELTIHAHDQDVREISERERLAELKSHIGSHIDRLNRELQTDFQKIQVKLNELESIKSCLETIKKLAPQQT